MLATPFFLFFFWAMKKRAFDSPLAWNVRFIISSMIPNSRQNFCFSDNSYLLLFFFFYNGWRWNIPLLWIVSSFFVFFLFWTPRLVIFSDLQFQPVYPKYYKDYRKQHSHFASALCVCVCLCWHIPWFVTLFVLNGLCSVLVGIDAFHSAIRPSATLWVAL